MRFAEMLEVVKQYESGLVSVEEMIMNLQCDEYQLAALRQFLSLPFQVTRKISLADFDDEVNRDRDMDKNG